MKVMVIEEDFDLNVFLLALSSNDSQLIFRKPGIGITEIKSYSIQHS